MVVNGGSAPVAGGAVDGHGVRWIALAEAAEGGCVATRSLVTVRPANEASCADLDAIFGPRGETGKCRCQRVRLAHGAWRAMPVWERADRLRMQTGCGDPAAASTSGIVAWRDGTPVGWCAVEPRTAYRRLHQPQVTIPWVGRAEDPQDASVWAVACFVTRAGYRKQGIATALARAAVDHARAGGAQALEGYPMLTREGKDIPWGELSVGSRNMFLAAGFTEVGRPATRRVVMRIDFADPPA
jgi:GNAT superfamily N-acetyltransferase